MRYSVKVYLPKNDRNEYITTVHTIDCKTILDATNEALNYVKRAQWIRLSDIEKTKLVVKDIKTL